MHDRQSKQPSKTGNAFFVLRKVLGNKPLFHFPTDPKTTRFRYSVKEF